MSTEKIIKSLQDGHMVCFPTDTLYALAVDAFNPTAVQKMYLAKKRPLNKPCAIMLGDITMIEKYAEVDSEQLPLIKKFLPGPVTFILKKKNDCSLPVGEKVGIRVPQNDHALKILQGFKTPILSTSANLANEEDARYFTEISDEILSKVDSYIKDDTDLSGIGSTVIDITTRPFTILRAGSLQISIN